MSHRVLKGGIFMERLWPILLLLLISTLISYFLTSLITKKNMKLLFLIPGIFLTAMIVFAILGFLSQDWGRLGYLIMASIALGMFIGSLISSFIIKSRNKSKLK